MEQNQLVKTIKKDAIITIKFGAGMIQLIQQSIMILTKDRTEEEIEKFRKEVANYNSNGTMLSEEWMNILLTLTILIKELEREAEKQNMITEVHIDELIKQFEESSNKLSEEENQ